MQKSATNSFPSFAAVDFVVFDFAVFDFVVFDFVVFPSLLSPPPAKRKKRAARSRFRPSTEPEVLKHGSALKQGPIFVGAVFSL